MRARIVLILILVGGILFYFSMREKGSVRLGSEAPAFALQNAEGETIRSVSFRGQVLLVNFWATFCHTCVTEIPSLNRLATHFRGRPFQILGISEDAGGTLAWETMARFQQSVPITFPILLDLSGHVADQYGTYLLPETYLLDGEGEVVRKITGGINWDDPQVIEEIDALVAEIEQG
ncbi:MAG: TlpA family protein disulfide reductase [Deltaproteobacteria bacterium]|nr:TlpA family protein disulfide reductase [Deltaproteobacteria bacterium]